MADPVAAGAAVVTSIIALKRSIDSIRFLGTLKKEVQEIMDELKVSCEEHQCLLQSEMECREDGEAQMIRKTLRRLFKRIKKYLDENEAEIVKSRMWWHYGQKGYYVKRVPEKVPKLTVKLEDLWRELRLVTGVPLRWLDRSNSSEQGGIQYACSGKRFGLEEADPCICLPDSRLDDLVEAVKKRAPVSPQRKPVGPKAEPTILVAHGQPIVGKTMLGVRVLETLESQDGGSFFKDGCVYLPMQEDGLTERKFAELVRDYILKCVARRSTYISPSGPDAPTRLSDVVDFFGFVVKERRCIFLLDDVWPRRRGSDGVRWNGNALDDVLRLASPESLVLVCSSNRGAVSFDKAGDIFSVPLAEGSLMEEVFRVAWNQKARISDSTLVIAAIEELGEDWAGAVKKVLNACGGLPAAAAAAGTALFRRKKADEGHADILTDLKGGVSQSMNPDVGLPEALRTRLDRSFKFCEDSVDSATYQSAMAVYRRVGLCELSPSWPDHEPGLLIKYWQRAPAASVVQVPLSSLCDLEFDGERDISKVKRLISELNKYIPICVSDDGKSAIICPLFYDHAKYLSAESSAAAGTGS